MPKRNSMDDSIHTGHRNRMMNKLFENPNALNDHEILEIALFFSIPRKNTNPIAHALLNTFGSLESVFRASKEELTAIDGIGPHAAMQIKVTFEILNRMLAQHSNFSDRFTYHTYRNRLYDFFDHSPTEKFIVLLLDKKQQIIKKLVFDSDFVNRVEVDLTQFAHEIALSKPHAVILMHNHPSGNVFPTHADDQATGKLALALSLQGVLLYDHIVVTQDDSYSYHYAGRMDEVQKKYNLERLMKKI